LRVLLIAEAANPEWVSVPLIGWSLARAIAGQMPAHLVTQVRNRDAIIRAGLIEGRDFTAIDSEKFAAPLWKLGSALRGGKGVGWTTVAAVAAISYYHFEHLIWKEFGPRIQRGDFDVVHRITPLSPTTPSTLAARCARASVPFVLGPLNGGVPWPKEFTSARLKEREWLSYLRDGYKLLPGYRSTLASSTAILAGSRSTFAGINKRFHDKCLYLPENAIDPERFKAVKREASPATVRACFVGRLVPYKGPDMLLEAVAPLVRSGRLKLDIIGDGPLMPKLRSFIDQHELSSNVTLHGWIDHHLMQSKMQSSELLLFPSIREFGGGVVLEAMALGIVPVVVDYAGPGELVNDDVGFKIRLGSRAEIVGSLHRLVAGICDNPQQLASKRAAATAFIRQYFTWEAKARQIIEVYNWSLGKSPKPEFALS
jgi:glycosyltransferase involved in cell wall biosynthesis